jgi:pentatricopeptide repeat protein
MRSHLTRSVFRRILANQPFTHSYCQRTPRKWVQNNGIKLHWAVQQRSFWSLFSSQRDDGYFPTEYQRYMEPGMQVMENLVEALDQQSRPPDTRKLVAAFTDFFALKANPLNRNSKGTSHPRPSIRLTEYYIQHLLITFSYLLDQRAVGQSLSDLGINDAALVDVLRLLSAADVDPEAGAGVADLSSNIFQALTNPTVEDEAKPRSDKMNHPIPVEPYIVILSLSGKSEDALSLFDRWHPQNVFAAEKKLLYHIIIGLAREGKEDAAMKVLESRLAPTGEIQGPVLRKTFKNLLDHSTKSRFVYLTKQMADFVTRSGADMQINSNTWVPTLLAFSIHTDDLKWGEQWYRRLLAEKGALDGEFGVENWTLVLLWLAVNGQSPEEMEKVVAGIMNGNEGGKSVRGPSIASINELVSYANSKNNPFAAERYLALGFRWGLNPDAETFLRQMEGRLQAGDVEGAVTCYKELEIKEQISEDRDLPGLNRLLQALCSFRNLDYNLLLTILDKLLLRKSSLRPETVAALCELFIQRGELGEATDLLKKARLDLYSKRQRELITRALFRLVTERKLKTLQAWQAYELLHKAFPELSVKDRTTIMNSFFDRDQADMACMVFGHMRQSHDKKKRPTADTYVECFEGLSQYPDEDSLQLVHNMLKLDTHVDLSTKILNALMLAYMNSNSPQRSLEYWDDILNSQEGPTYNSIVIVLQACQRAMGGHRVARVIMQRLASLEVDVTQQIYAAYIGALSHHGDHELAFQLVDSMQADMGLTPDTLMFVTPFNKIISMS